jgi:TetR/AcrR family transcriptional regulator, cholesterol catabolism regulator
VTTSATTASRGLKVAAELFASRGYGGTTTRELSAAMGVTNGTFYHHFASKEELLREVCLRALEVLDARVDATLDGAADDPITRLRELVETHVMTITEDRHAHITMLTDARALTGEHRAQVVAARDRYEHRVREVVADGQRRGALRADLETATLTRLLLNLLNWTIFWYDQGGELLEAELADQMLVVFLDGVRA